MPARRAWHVGKAVRKHPKTPYLQDALRERVKPTVIVEKLRYKTRVAAVYISQFHQMLLAILYGYTVTRSNQSTQSNATARCKDFAVEWQLHRRL
jgi:hypothetical protein